MKNGERGSGIGERLRRNDSRFFIPQSPFPVPRSSFFVVPLLVALLLSGPRPASACPFCQAVQPTLSQRKESSAVAALAEAGEREGRQQVFNVVQVLRGKERLANSSELTMAGDQEIGAGGLALLLGTPQGDGEALDWSAVAVNEASCAYVARAPSLRVQEAKRLEYFVPFLSHADPLICEDAWREFAHASFDDVAAVAGRLPMQQFRTWLTDPNTPQERKGFIGLALGLAPNADDRRANVQLLKQTILAPANDFRAGFDGVLGGYLIAEGPAALKLIEKQFLANPRAADGDVRHVLTALRFYHEYGRGIPPERQAQALRLLLGRPEFAAAALVDLARWQDWDSLEQATALYAAQAPLATRRAVIGYLQVCPLPAARDHLAQLRQQDPPGVAEAEKALSAFRGQQ